MIRGGKEPSCDMGNRYADESDRSAESGDTTGKQSGIPEASEGDHSNIGTIGFALGFALMMVLDVVLG